MNEQLKELAEQAGGFVDLNKHVGGNNGCIVYNYAGLQKFADLIIQECVARIQSCHLVECYPKVDGELVSDEFELGYKKAINKATSQVLLHFEVE